MQKVVSYGKQYHELNCQSEHSLNELNHLHLFELEENMVNQMFVLIF